MNFDNPSGANNLRINTFFFVFFGHSIKLRYDDLFYKSSSTSFCAKKTFFSALETYSFFLMLVPFKSIYVPITFEKKTVLEKIGY